MIDICRAESETAQPNTDDWLFEFQLANGPLVRFRDVTPADAELIAESIRTASAETLFHRFFSPIRSLPIETLRNLLNIDRPSSLCLVGEITQDEKPRIICGARFVRSSPDDVMAEFAITVHDEFQNRGLGTLLLRKLAEQARNVGVVDFEGYVLYTNTGMRHLIQRMSSTASWTYSDEVIRVVIPIESLVNPPVVSPSVQPLPDKSTEIEAPLTMPSKGGPKPKSMKRMIVRLARILSMNRHRRKAAQSTEPPPESLSQRPPFRRRPR